MLSLKDKVFAVLSHLLTIVLFFIPPLLIWLSRKGQSEYVTYHAKESLNFQLFLAICYLVSAFLILAVYGAFMLPILFAFHVVMVITAAVRSGLGQRFQYPFTLHFIR